MGLKLDFWKLLPIGMSFIPGIGPMMAGAISGGIETLRTGNLGRGLMSGLLAGGLNAGIGSLAGPASEGAAAATAKELGDQAAMSLDTAIDPAYKAALEDASAEAAKQTPWDRLSHTVEKGDWKGMGEGFFPSNTGMLAKPGVLAGIGALGMSQYDAIDAQKRAYDEEMERRREGRPSVHLATEGNARPYNYEDPYSVAYSGRTTPHFERGGQVMAADRHYETLKRFQDGERWNRMEANRELIDDEGGKGSVVTLSNRERPLMQTDLMGDREGAALERMMREMPKHRMAEGGIVGVQNLMQQITEAQNAPMPQPQYTGPMADMMKRIADVSAGLTQPAPSALPERFSFLQPFIDVANKQSNAQSEQSPGFASGGLAALPGAQHDVNRRRSGAAMLRSIYPNKKAAIADLRNPDSPASRMGVKGPDDPLLRAAFPEEGIGRLITGPGDGRSDSVPAVIDGHQPAEIGRAHV